MWPLGSDGTSRFWLVKSFVLSPLQFFTFILNMFIFLSPTIVKTTKLLGLADQEVNQELALDPELAISWGTCIQHLICRLLLLT